MFKFQCECGAPIVVEGRTGRCARCGVEFRIVWPAPDVKPGTIEHRPLTISEKYDDTTD